MDSRFILALLGGNILEAYFLPPRFALPFGPVPSQAPVPVALPPFLPNPVPSCGFTGFPEPSFLP